MRKVLVAALVLVSCAAGAREWQARQAASRWNAERTRLLQRLLDSAENKGRICRPLRRFFLPHLESMSLAAQHGFAAGYAHCLEDLPARRVQSFVTGESRQGYGTIPRALGPDGHFSPPAFEWLRAELRAAQIQPGHSASLSIDP